MTGTVGFIAVICRNKRGPALTKKMHFVGIPITKRIKHLPIGNSNGKESLILEATERIPTKFGTAQCLH